jgi:hypothetical protein
MAPGPPFIMAQLQAPALSARPSVDLLAIPPFIIIPFPIMPRIPMPMADFSRTGSGVTASGVGLVATAGGG